MITSTGNPGIRNIISLKKKAKERNEQDVFLVEGIRSYREIPKEMLVKTYVSESFLSHPDARRQIGDVPYETVSDSVFRSMSDTQTPQGILGVVRQFHYNLSDLLDPGEDAAGQPLVLVLENLQDPGNLGTILRSAEGAGVTGVLLSRGCVDLYNPKVIRSTMGCAFRVPFCYTDDLAGVLQGWKEHGIRVFAAHLDGQRSYTEESYLGGSAFLIGNEGNGLTEETAGLADCYIRIPMKGKVESLNASVAASLLVYEALRQRTKVC